VLQSNLKQWRLSFGQYKPEQQETFVTKRIKIGVGLLGGLPVALFLAIQLIPVWLLQTNPPVVAEPAWDSPQTRALAKRACFDCHSNETTWPVYARIAPMSWLVTRNVIAGRGRLNFSEWGVARSSGEGGEGGEGGRGGERAGGEFARTIERGSMPPSDYLLTHPGARLTDAEKQQLIDGLQKSLK
jgi:hypothetical protein